ncbi:beta-CASP ribonuclease aCPSF1 [archaeon]|nr:beta-CASP ribonuclease aCPSF1 [archaeon]
MAEFLKEIEKQICELLPADCAVESVDLEGPEVVIYSRNIGAFLNDESLIKALAGKLKKRFIVRGETSTLKPVEEAERTIRETIPPEAEVSSVIFDVNFNEVVIEAKKLGLVIGSGGETLKKIALQTGWMPRLLRSPTTQSPIVSGIRRALIEDGKDIKRFLKKTGTQIYRRPSKPADWIRITGLGACREVGRSAFLVETPESKVLLDCGVSIAGGENAFPYLSSISFPLEELDAVVVSHAHLDHSGFVPFLYHYGYKGPVYCTPPTRDVMALLQVDFMDVMAKEGRQQYFNEKSIREEVKHCITRDYGEVTDIAPDIRLTLYNAGHILGSAQTHLHIGPGGHNLLYTGDLKFGYSELLDIPDTRFPRLETLIIESTYGGPNDRQPPRQICDQKLIDTILQTTEKNGTVIIPTFAVERAQEIMLVLENYARSHSWDIPVYLDGMIREANSLHTVYPEYLKRVVQRRVLHNDSPFDSNIFNIVEPKQRNKIVEEGRAVVMAPAGMMVGGPVLQHFKNASEDPKNTLVFVGYQAQRSIGKRIQSGAKDIVLDDAGKPKQFKVNMRVESIEGLSAHSDLGQLLGYIKRAFPRPEKALVVHGEERKCINLANTISSKFHIEATAPQNLDSIRLK